MKINTVSEAYIHALSLAHTAPSQILKEECLKMASNFEESMSLEEILFCKMCFEDAKKDFKP
tara:strand:- start:1088 stop:1273 length:186 start_codon:yes stop_codon:yes gene_type:complete